MKYPESERIKTLRGKESFREFAEKFDVTGSNVQNIEGENQRLSIPLALKLVNYYNVTLDWLYGISEEGGPAPYEAQTFSKSLEEAAKKFVIDSNKAEAEEALNSANEKFYIKIIEEKDQRIALLERYIEDQKGLIDLYKGLAEKKQS